MKSQRILKLGSFIIWGWFILVILAFGIPQAKGNVVLGFSPKEFLDPIPSPGAKIQVNITLRDFDGSQGAGDIAGVEFYVDYDSTVVKIVNPTPSGFPTNGDVDLSGFTNFETDKSVFSGDMNVLTNEAGQLVPPPSAEFTNPLNVHRFIFAYATASDFPLKPPANPTAATPLITISFTVIAPTITPVIFLTEKGKFVDSQDNVIDFIRESGDLALPVELSDFGAIWHMGEGIKIFWEAASQRGNLGWNIYRSETKDGKFVKINGELIKGAGTTSNAIKYSFIDKDAKKGKVYYYYLEDISFNGEKHRTDLIKSIPVNKIISWGDIKRSSLR
jgi:hypothetical protein